MKANVQILANLNTAHYFANIMLAECKKETQVKTKKIMEKMFYVRNEGYLGNALIWWKKGRNGYTCDINDAHQFTYEEAESVCRRKEDTAYECEYIDKLLIAQKLIIDCQYVDESQRLFTK